MPGTGKTSVVAAIANYMRYSVYDLDLTGVKSNLDLRALLMQISDRAVVVIEDIDTVELPTRTLPEVRLPLCRCCCICGSDALLPSLRSRAPCTSLLIYMLHSAI